ncbi:MAG: metal ABC transporter ATP-binding protein [Spirochaetes bacterium]|nr:metal ABC transporter ATP-binding protein [Spirochaetota bacterium]
MSAIYAIELANIFAGYEQNRVLENINLVIEEREIVSIVGPNGSGKTTLLKIIMGLQSPWMGKVSIFGMDPQIARQRGVFGYLSQQSISETNFPVCAFDVVAMSRYAKSGFFEKLSRKDREIIERAIERVGMREWKNYHFGSLSGGQKQRFLIARALAMEPKILILDEPVTWLDAAAQDSFYELIKTLRDEEGLTILMVSHDIGAVSEIVDRLACLNRTIHFHGKPSECAPEEMFVKVFGQKIHVVRHDKNCPTCRGD